MNLNIIQLFWVDHLELHFFCHILCMYHPCVFVYLYSECAELHFHSGWSLIFTVKFTVLVVVFKCALLENYLFNSFQTYSI